MHHAHRAHCTMEVSRVLRHAAEHSPRTSKQSDAVTCSAHMHQGSWMQPNTHALVHCVHRAHRTGGTLYGIGWCKTTDTVEHKNKIDAAQEWAWALYV